jgi:hypothetical protein
MLPEVQRNPSETEQFEKNFGGFIGDDRQMQRGDMQLSPNPLPVAVG